MREESLERLKLHAVLELEACGGVNSRRGVGVNSAVTAEFLGINSAGNSFICLRNQSHGFGSGILSPSGSFFLKKEKSLTQAVLNRITWIGLEKRKILSGLFMAID